MLKYLNTEVTFSEIPDEITLCINITGCKCACPGCHSSYLAEDIGEELTPEVLKELILKNMGISCICIMGGDSNPEYVEELAMLLKFQSWYPVKTAWYSGRQYIPDEIDISYFDYIKIGPYIEKLGPLTNPLTNQIMYQVIDDQLIDITHKFWKNVTESSIQ